MAAINQILICSLLVFFVGVAHGKEPKDDNNTSHQPEVDNQVDTIINDEDNVIEDSSDAKESDEDVVQKIASFVDAYKKTVKNLEAGMEQFNSHIQSATKKIGQDLKEKFEQMRRNREDL